jgi:UDPglucose--hexose-1-phosphate uridylyltransferase
VSELRQDPFTGSWSIVAEGRGARPNEHAVRVPDAVADPDCPFCDGHEDRTPPEIAALRPRGSAPNNPRWSARAIPNRFPSLGGTPSDPATVPPPAGGAARPGTGTHEVIIESPRHAPAMRELSGATLRALFRFFRERLAAVEHQPGVRAAMLFENWGPESGGTLWHPHAQLAGYPVVPPKLEAERARFGGGDRCVLEAATDAELADGRRTLEEGEHLVAYAPYGSGHPFEVRIVPRQHRPTFSSATDGEVDALASVLPAVLRALDRVAPGASYDWWIHGDSGPDGGRFHWHVEVVPRLVKPDGFELGSGLLVNPVPPESAARQLVAALRSDPGPNPR